jgi:prepilin-type processing-associated H-X9-DG protein
VNLGNTPGRKGVVVWSGRGAKMTLQGLSDGTSNVVMVAEKSIPATRQGNDGGDNERWNNSGWDEDNIRWHFPPTADADVVRTPPTFDYWNNPASTSTAWRRNFGSAHTGGLNAVFADGSVRFVRFNVNPETWMRVIVSDDGAPTNLSDL